MAISGSNLAKEYFATDATSFTTTASITPSANALVLCYIDSTEGVAPSTTPTVSGNGLTWVLVNNRIQGGGHDFVFRAMGASPSSGQVTVDFGATTKTSCTVIVDQFTGVDTSGTNGSGAVVQSAVNSAATGTSLTVTLAAFGDSTNNVAYGGHAHAANEAVNVGTGFTELGEATGASPNRGTQTEWKIGEDTSVDASWTSSAANLGIALEIKAASAAVGGGVYYHGYYERQIAA